MTAVLSRRRFITLAAAAAGLPLLLRTQSSAPRLARWEGTALGAPASIQLYHQNEAQAQAALHASITELQRLEKIFSVYRADSAISLLNRTGSLENAPHDLMFLLEHALTLAKISDGFYDPTVQPLWQLYFRHFTASNPNLEGPSVAEIQNVLSRVDWQNVEVDIQQRRIVLSRSGVEITLNGGAQGYITDRVADVLRVHGFESMLVDMGEPRAFSTKPDGSAWRVGIANPADPSRSLATLDLVDQCISTSGGYGTLFDPEGKFTHLLDPKTGRTAPAYFSVSVVAKSGTTADGLSTALLLAPPDRRQSILTAAGGQKAIFVTPKGIDSTLVA
ncbi:FAD:protein FMN transferase [Gammaproteobacteria bacterium]